jgi:hypothetical protein
LEDDINKFFKTKAGSGAHDSEIEFLKDQLVNGSTTNYNYATIQDMRKRLANLEASP